MSLEEFKNMEDLYKAKTFGTIHLSLIEMSKGILDLHTETVTLRVGTIFNV